MTVHVDGEFRQTIVHLVADFRGLRAFLADSHMQYAQRGLAANFRLVASAFKDVIASQRARGIQTATYSGESFLMFPDDISVSITIDSLDGGLASVSYSESGPYKGLIFESLASTSDPNKPLSIHDEIDAYAEVSAASLLAHSTLSAVFAIAETTFKETASTAVSSGYTTVPLRPGKSPLGKYCKRSENATGVDFETMLGEDFGKVVEAFNRRHVLTHNRGTIDEYYATHVDNAALQPGDRHQTSVDYLTAIMDVCEDALVKYCLTSWQQISDGRSDAWLEVAITIQYRRMVEGRWEEAAAFADTIGIEVGPDRLPEYQLHRWCALKMAGRGQEIVHELEAMEKFYLTSGPIWRIAFLVAADCPGEALAVLKEQQELLNPYELADIERSPLFERLRSEPGFSSTLVAHRRPEVSSGN